VLKYCRYPDKGRLILGWLSTLAHPRPELPGVGGECKWEQQRQPCDGAQKSCESPTGAEVRTEVDDNTLSKALP
jgi:hypothetical protein